MRRFLLVIGLFVSLAAGAFLYARSLDEGPGPLAQARAVVVPHGGVDEIGRVLAGNGVVSHPRIFRVLALATTFEGPLHAGEFSFPARASIETVLHILRTARPIQHKITIPEGSTAADIALLLARADALSDTVDVPEEGTFFPDTYAYERGATVRSIEIRAQRTAQNALAREWANRAPGLPLASPTDALILASMVERETPLAAERPLVAAVFLNRLHARQKLQSDPTAAYAIAGGLPLARPLTRDDLATANPYNTYWTQTLPPGPICAPSLSSLHAVLHPAGSRALYFVADGSGGHVFADTLAEHNANITQIRARRHL